MKPDNQFILKKIIYVLGILLIILIIFGYRRATYSFIWHENYNKDALQPVSFMAPFMHDEDDVNPDSAIGNIVSMHIPFLLIKGKYQSERTVIVGSTTSIRFADRIASTTDLTMNRQIIAIGTPDDKGQIQATFIRILNSSPGGPRPSP